MASERTGPDRHHRLMEREPTACWNRDRRAPHIHNTAVDGQENAMMTVKAAAVQMSPVLYSREGTVDKVVRTIHELGHNGVQFATFPETVVPYYPYFSFVQSAYQIIAGREHLKLLDQGVTVPSPATDAIGEACADAGVVASVGVNE